MLEGSSLVTGTPHPLGETLALPAAAERQAGRALTHPFSISPGEGARILLTRNIAHPRAWCPLAPRAPPWLCLSQSNISQEEYTDTIGAASRDPISPEPEGGARPAGGSMDEAKAVGKRSDVDVDGCGSSQDA